VDPVRAFRRAIAQNGLAELTETETRHALEYTIRIYHRIKGCAWLSYPDAALREP
jgi:hypothetical protein